VPETIYYQMDGGPENCNTEMLGICALIVARYNPNYKKDGKGMGVKRIFVTRLPPGHTHEDCDAQFGVIWLATRRKHILTPSEYKRIIEQCLQKSNVEVIDVFAVPDYAEALRDCLDDKFGK
jgi:hypothetical protein